MRPPNGDRDQPDENEERPADAVDVPERRPSRLYRGLSGVLEGTEAAVRARGSRRIRLAVRLLWWAIAAVGVFLLIGPVINKPLGLDDITSTAEKAGESWIASDFSAHYTLVRDDEGRLDAHVRERFTAVVPADADVDSIERVVPAQYHSHGLDPRLTGARLDGKKADPAVSSTPTAVTYRLGEGGRLTGRHEVELDYTLHDPAYSTNGSDTEEDLFEWDVFGPDFPHGAKNVRLAVTMPSDLADALGRTPQAGVRWTLLSNSVPLKAEDGRGGGDTTTLVATNGQTLPPHASFWFRLPFEAGTVTMPPPSAFFWVQAAFPALPLALLLLTLLFSFAARAVAWADARGRAWYVYQSDPPKGIRPLVAARVLGRNSTARLAEAVYAYQRHPDRKGAAARLARATRRAGGASAHGSAGRAEQHTLGLRRIPRGFVRDSFLGAALAWPIVQWGLVRQLSYQVPLDEHWWPYAIAGVSSALAVLVLVVTLSAQPLTRKGALVKEHLLGMELFAAQTLRPERTTLKDPLLPYMVVFLDAPEAKRMVAGLLDEGVLAAAKKKKTRRSPWRSLGPALAGAAVLAAIALIVVAPSPYVDAQEDEAYSQDHYDGALEGNYGLYIADFEAKARLVPRDGGRVALRATETYHVDVATGLRHVPQLVRQWRGGLEGEDAGLTVRSVTVDGETVPYEQLTLQRRPVLRTTMHDEWPGEHTVVVRYRLADAVTAAGSGDGERIRWTALDPGWRNGWRGPDVEPARIAYSLAVPKRLAAKAETSGALGGGDWPATGLRDAATSTRRDGAVVHRQEFRAEDTNDFFDLQHDRDGELFSPARDFHGIELRFPAGSVAGADRDAHARYATLRMAATLLPVLLAFVVVASVVGGIALWASGRAKGLAQGVILWGALGAGVAQCILIGWVSAGGAGPEALAVSMLVTSIVVALAGFVAAEPIVRRINPAAVGAKNAGKRKRRNAKRAGR